MKTEPSTEPSQVKAKSKVQDIIWLTALLSESILTVQKELSPPRSYWTRLEETARAEKSAKTSTKRKQTSTYNKPDKAPFMLILYVDRGNTLVCGLVHSSTTSIRKGTLTDINW